MGLGRRRRLVVLGAVVLMLAACTRDPNEPATSVEVHETSTSSSTIEVELTSTSSTSTSTTLPIETFDPQVIGSYVFSPVDWGIIVDSAGPGVHLVHMVVEVRSIIEDESSFGEEVTEIEGQLVWDETVIDLCRVEDRTRGDPRLDSDEYDRDEFMWIGDITYTDEYCSEWTHFRAMQVAFDDYGLPQQGCITLVSDGFTHQLCEQLYELPATYEWNPDGA